MSAPPRTAEPSLATRSTALEVLILWVAAAVALTYLVLQRPYAGDVALKMSMCVLLAIAAFRGKLKLFALALLFSAAGDAFLAYDGERLFVHRPGELSRDARAVCGRLRACDEGRRDADERWTQGDVRRHPDVRDRVQRGAVAEPRRDGDAVVARSSDRGATRRGAVHGFGQPDLAREVLVRFRTSP